ncbi:hypothetical protein GPY51_24310 [Photorhabdus laumondii subsp. laumondii]|uniref:Photorhabdus luminescens subsp. laumondii TTO1 complete genome segment 1/17 n=2 Tax=Photorhabdus laumondii subsp. laumondii TaxID=141679 RepID=Q7N9K1_PHOLL|nr:MULTISPECIES: immunity 50 family protein [Photorhabdus]AWK40303.1 hypothetical protein A4R40_01590 [Photorhabdus laumondii subsp. laumondii]AXG41135.1 hypothetical protein PluDJC_01700 [Photorhabdus laumondii subsp. laumondii]AXG45650.1 hypothetical protein PluTT01m_01665 [Photorhabdus laumondii subsp. laumondii]MCC8386513.1 immunity 50 family protein [Photorhabdus laumondii]MCC8390830.1 immunity 50 family protein [Photorhabdus laumondii]
MWFDHAIFKEKIKFMFNNELSMEHVGFEQFLYYDTSRLKIFFCSKNIPNVIPEKWRRKKFNCFMITLTCIDVSVLEINGGGVAFECTPIIESTKEKTEITIKNDGFYLHCSTRTMVIEDITPHWDVRWTK